MSSATLEVTVEEIRKEAVDIFSFRLVDPAGRDLPASTPGAHVDVYIEPGLVRQYSLCNGPEERASYTIAVKRQPDSRGGSAWMDERVKPGDRLTIGAPVNHFPLDLTSPHSILIAGGVGITPLLSMSRYLLAEGAAFELHYFAHSAEQAAFRDRLSQPDYAGKVEFHFALGRPDIQQWAARALSQRPVGGQLYVCGPLPFMSMVESTAAPHWPPGSMHAEYFTADQQRLAAPGDEFDVILARHGGSFIIPKDKTIEHVLTDNGIEVEVSCEEGVCGTCVTKVIEGIPDHRDTFLTNAEKASNAMMTICVSRAKTRTLVLDL
jgi:vanillate O-demethylase ferredoxin subunit